MSRIIDIKPMQVYKHFTGNTYIIIGLAEHTETGETMVIYSSDKGNKIYARPYRIFISEVDKVKYPRIEQKYRFELVED